MKRVLGVDADVLVYRSSFAAQTNIHRLVDREGNIITTFSSKREANEMLEMYEGDEDYSIESFVSPQPLSKATKHCDKIISDAKKHTKSDEVICFLSGSTNFREDIATIKPYKGNRVAEKPYHYKGVTAHILKKYNTVVSDNCEADDLLATHLFKEYKRSAKTKDKMECRFVCCTIDKDLRTVPGWHYNFVKKGEVDWVTNKDAYSFFWKQMLMGDTADNIPGVKGIGPVGANLIINPLTNQKDMFVVVASKYEKQYGKDWLRCLTEVGRLLHMQRFPGDAWTPKPSWLESYGNS